MKIALAQLNYHVGNFDANTKAIINAIRRAEKEQIDLVVFAELAVCGYPPLDFLDYDHFIERCIQSVNEIATHTMRTAVIVGAPSRNPDPKGKNLFNSAWFLAEGQVMEVVPKSLLPTYDVFDEYRWFEPGPGSGCIMLKGVRIALTVCEDLWNMDADPLYDSWPMEKLILEQPQLMINVAASPFSFSHAEDRKKILAQNISKYKLPLVYINQVGAHTDIIFDGGSLAYNKNGELISEAKYFDEDFVVVDFDADKNDFLKAATLPVTESNQDKESAIYNALICGIRDYFQKMGFTKATLGMSGGIDSAIVLALAVEALGAKNVHAVMMPSEYSSDHSVNDSERMIAKLGCTSALIPIERTYNSFLEALKPSFADRPFNTAEENIQSRTRGVLLMALSNKLGYILLNTSNKSELAVGYGTLYGDMAGGLSVIGDLYKTQIYALAQFINRNDEIIPANIINKPPSAELRPGQKDSDSLPPYDLLDAILFRYIEQQKGPDQIIAEGFDEAIVYKIMTMVNANEWKRFQFAPILRVSSKAFGRGRRMPLVAKYGK